MERGAGCEPGSPPRSPAPRTSLLKISTARDGVMVMALMAEMTVETAIVTANWRKNWPVMPLMNAHGTNTAHSTRPTAMIGPVTSSIALMVAVRASRPLAIMPLDVFQHDDGVVHHDADGQHQAEQRDVVQAEAQSGHDGEGADEETGTSIIGRIMARQSCRKNSTTMPTRTTASSSVCSTSSTDSRMYGVVS